MLAFASVAHAGFYQYSQTLNCATNFAASSTNSTPSTEYLFPSDQVPQKAFISVRGNGTAATTNGSFKVYLGFYNGTNWDTGSLNTNAVVTIPSLGASTNQVSVLFSIECIRGIRVDHVENTFLGPVSNALVNANFQVQK